MDLSIVDVTDMQNSGHVVLPAGDVWAVGQPVLLSCRGRRCGAVVHAVEPGINEVRTDAYLRAFLRARAGETVQVRAGDFTVARSIVLDGPVQWQAPEPHGLLKNVLMGRPLTAGQKLSLPTMTGADVLLEVLAIEPSEIALVGISTRITVEAKRAALAQNVTYQDIGGLGSEIKRIRELIEFPLRSPEVFGRVGIEVPHGILLHGPPGTGKTLIAKALSTEVGAECYTIQGPEIVNPYYGKSEQRLREMFEAAAEHAPAIVLIDEVDAIAPKREDTRDELERRLVTTLLTLMDGLTDRRGVVVIGTTNRLNAIDPALRRPGRFEHEIHVGLPARNGRLEILKIRTRRMALAADVSLEDVADQTPGFVGADLASLCREAAYDALRRIVPESQLARGEIDTPGEIRITPADFRTAMSKVKPSGLREVIVEAPEEDVNLKNVGGLEQAKQVLLDNVIQGIRHPEAFRRAGIRPGQGLLLFGPPGTGKSLLARAIARESGANPLIIRGPEIRSKWFGESEQRLRSLFAKARELAPCIVLMDELDAIAAARGHEQRDPADAIVTQLLCELDLLRQGNGVFVIGTTNKIKLLDPSLLRPGRFDHQVYIPLPDLAARNAIFHIHLAGKPPLLDVDVETLAADTDQFSGADIAEVCRLAVLHRLGELSFKTEGLQLDKQAFRHAIDNLRTTNEGLHKAGF